MKCSTPAFYLFSHLYFALKITTIVHMDTYDVLIIGGGPAGLSAAMHIAQTAPELVSRMLVLEKAHYPRPKLCAGGLVADAVVILEGLGLDVSEIPHATADSAHFDFRGRGLEIGLLPWQKRKGRHLLKIIRRDEFDAWLAGKARAWGIEIQEGIEVRTVHQDIDGVTVETEQGRFHAKFVIGADGSNGVTRRAILPKAPLFTARVLETIVPSPIFEENGGESGRGPIAFFDFFPVPSGINGYIWDFPTQVQGQPMRCWGIYDANLFPGDKKPPLRETLAAEMARYGLNLADFELKGHPIRWFDPFNPLSAGRVLLAGDSAGADPIFGEGISMALGYGRVAAGEAVSAIRQGKTNFDGYRLRVAMSPLGQTLFVRWVIGYIIYTFSWAWFQFLLWRILKPVVVAVAWVFVLNWAKRMPKR